jgi:hypothetical protein
VSVGSLGDNCTNINHIYAQSLSNCSRFFRQQWLQTSKLTGDFPILLIVQCSRAWVLQFSAQIYDLADNN